MSDDAPSMYALEELGRKPLSTHFFMRDFLYSESASLARIVNYPDDPKIASSASAHSTSDGRQSRSSALRE